jgi:hypothetical protein
MARNSAVPAVALSLRLTIPDRELVERLAAHDGETFGETIRAAIRDYAAKRLTTTAGGEGAK